MKNFFQQFPWRKHEPEPELRNDYRFDGFTGWHDVRDEQAEATRIATIERRAADAEAEREAGSMDRFRYGPPTIDAANL